MPQGRIVLKSICQSRKLAELKTDGARLLYTWLLTSVDINGCFSGDPEVIKGQIFTRLKKSTKVIQGYVEDLDLVGLIIWYKANGDVFLHIPDFTDRQPSLNPDREAKSTIPMPSPDQLQMKSRQTPPKVKESKEKVKQSKICISEIELLKNKFDTARKLFKGKKNGLSPEWENFTRKHGSYRSIVPLLLPAIEKEVAWREAARKIDGYFVPPWKNFQTWINNSCWTQELPLLNTNNSQEYSTGCCLCEAMGVATFKRKWYCKKHLKELRGY